MIKNGKAGYSKVAILITDVELPVLVTSVSTALMSSSININDAFIIQMKSFTGNPDQYIFEVAFI